MDDFEKLCQQNKELVYRYLLALCRDVHLAEELTAETFYRAYLHIDRFRGECKAATWLCRIARNAYYKACKKASRQESLENIAETAAAEYFLDRLCDREQVMEIYQALHALQEPYKEVFSLRVRKSEFQGDRSRLRKDGHLGAGHLLSGKGKADTEDGGKR